MKSFLIAAGLLMTGASVYGIVDYNKKAGTREFKELYKEQPAPPESEVKIEKASVVEKKDLPEKETIKKTETTTGKKAIKKKSSKKKKDERIFRMKEFSRGKLG